MHTLALSAPPPPPLRHSLLPMKRKAEEIEPSEEEAMKKLRRNKEDFKIPCGCRSDFCQLLLEDNNRLRFLVEEYERKEQQLQEYSAEMEELTRKQLNIIRKYS